MLKPAIGPIIGHTTTDHARIFIGADLKPTPHPVFAGVRYRRQGESDWPNITFAELVPSHDMSAVIVLAGLQANTAYEYQAGWMTTLNRVHTAQTVRAMPLQWPEEIYRFRTPAPTDTPHAYILGSCRYLRITGGAPANPENGDRTFAGINRVVDQAYPQVSAVMMMGDQVYLDDLNAVAPDRSASDIRLKYRTAFSQPHIARLMSRVPTYMILDDHEIEDNWPANRNSDDDNLYKNAMQAYGIYQASHSPAHERLSDGTLSQSLEKYWYLFAHGDIEWFVTDSRTRRNLSAQDRRMLDEAQEHALLSWLIASTARVKFVVTSVLFYPDRKIDTGDAWQAFGAQRLRVLETIREHAIANVIFLSGDVHGSLTSRLTHSDDPDFVVHTVISSPFCNSNLLPYASAASFVLNRPLARTAKGDYQYELTSNVIGQDNFARLYVAPQSLHVTFHDRDGNLLNAIYIPLR